MREQLEQYVNLLFAGAADSEDIKQEILQNTLDRYDDLVAQGKVPEAAYRLAISGIGDINEILGTNVPRNAVSHLVAKEDDEDTPTKKLLRAIAVGLYILSPLPWIVLGDMDMGMDALGLCGTLAIVAVATVLIMLGAKKENKESQKENDTRTPLQKGVSALVWAIGLAVYICWSFTCFEWHITWIVFPILAALDSLLTVLVKQKEQQGSIRFSFGSDKPLRKRIQNWIWIAGIFLFVIVSLRTLAWGATWLILPATAAAAQLAKAILDYMEVMEHET